MGFLWNEWLYRLFIGGPLFIIRAWVVGETVGVLGVPGVHDLGVDLEGVEPWKGVRGRVAWCGALLTEASSGGQSWKLEVALRRAEEEARESDVCEEEPGCLGWTPHL